MAAADYCTIQDITTIFRALTVDETTKATALIPIVCNALRVQAEHVGKDLDEMISDNAFLASEAKEITASIVARLLMTPTDGAPVTQSTESAGGYSFTGTFLNPGGGIFIKREELRRLGLRRQRMGVIEFC